MYYIYDNPLQGWKNGEPKKELWESIRLFKDEISDSDEISASDEI
jgi:hypothetical protein